MITYLYKLTGKTVAVYLWCQGCKCCHGFPIHVDYYVGSQIKREKKPVWWFNGNINEPTLTPSLRLYWTDPDTKIEHTTCHIIVTNGKMHFCNDCAHELKGQTLDLVEIPANYGLPGK